MSRMESQRYLSLSGMRKKEPKKKGSKKKNTAAGGDEPDEENPLVQDRLLSKSKKTNMGPPRADGFFKKIGQSNQVGVLAVTAAGEAMRSFADHTQQSKDSNKRSHEGAGGPETPAKKPLLENDDQANFRWTTSRRLSEAVNSSLISTSSNISVGDLSDRNQSTPTKTNQAVVNMDTGEGKEEDSSENEANQGGIVFIGSTETADTDTTAEENTKEEKELQ